VRARVVAEVLDSYNDYIWGQGYTSPDPVNDGVYFVWDHDVGTPAPLQITAVPSSLPVVVVVPRTVDQAYVENIGAAFGLTGQVLAAPDGSAFYMAGGTNDALQLKVDAATGGFLFQNLDGLWTKPEMPRTLPSPGIASSLALNFLAQHDNLADALFFSGQPTVTEGPTDGTDGTDSAVLGAAATQTPTDIAVHYARTIDIGGGMPPSIVGPGSRQNLYVGDNSAIIGMKGGWREVQLDGGRATVPIMALDEAWAGFLANPNLALAKLPLVTSYVTAGKPAPTLAYYEQPSAQGQSQLIPVWVFVADLYAPYFEGELSYPAPATAGQLAAAADVLVVSDANIYVPAATDGSATLQASITSPAPDTTVLLGQGVGLEGTASGGLAPYTFQWSSSVDGALGTGATVAVPGLAADLRSGSAPPNVIMLRVTDANGVEASASVDVTVQASIEVSATPAAGGTPSGGGSYDAGATVTVYANANPCYSFVNWTEGGSAVSTAADYSFTASSNRTLVANY
jgi:hypothetical protein